MTVNARLSLVFSSKISNKLTTMENSCMTLVLNHVEAAFDKVAAASALSLPLSAEVT